MNLVKGIKEELFRWAQYPCFYKFPVQISLIKAIITDKRKIRAFRALGKTTSSFCCDMTPESDKKAVPNLSLPLISLLDGATFTGPQSDILIFSPKLLSSVSY